MLGVRRLCLGTWLTVPSLVEFSTGSPEQASFNQNRLPIMALQITPCVLFGWWFSSWELLAGIWLVDIVVLPMELQTLSAPSVLTLTSPLEPLHSV